MGQLALGRDVKLSVLTFRSEETFRVFGKSVFDIHDDLLLKLLRVAFKAFQIQILLPNKRTESFLIKNRKRSGLLRSRWNLEASLPLRKLTCNTAVTLHLEKAIALPRRSCGRSADLWLPPLGSWTANEYISSNSKRDRHRVYYRTAKVDLTQNSAKSDDKERTCSVADTLHNTMHLRAAAAATCVTMALSRQNVLCLANRLP
jgi:hypothetical protein